MTYLWKHNVCQENEKVLNTINIRVFIWIDDELENSEYEYVNDSQGLTSVKTVMA